MSEKIRPTVIELEKIMADAGDREVVLHPDGTVSVESGRETAESDAPDRRSRLTNENDSLRKRNKQLRDAFTDAAGVFAVEIKRLEAENAALRADKKPDA